MSADISRCFLALDAGTSAGRAMVCDQTGHVLAEVVHPWRYNAPMESAPWGRDFDSEEFWSYLCQAAAKALQQAGMRTVSAIAATGQRQATIFLDAAGHTLYSGPNVDLRAAFEGACLLEEQGERIHAITGHLPPIMFASARWQWFRQKHPEICQRTRSLLMMSDWLTWQLCGASVTEASNAAETGLFDVAKGEWSAELLDKLAVPPEILPTVVPAGTIAGHLRPDVAGAFGLQNCPPVVVAGADTPGGLLGMNVTINGQVGVVAGWSAPVQMVTSRPIFDPQRALWTTCSLLPQNWLLEGNPGPAGAAHTWSREMFLPTGDYAELDELAASAAPGAQGVLAFLGPRLADYNNPQLLWGGVLLPQANGFLPVGRAELVRASLENVAFAIRANLEMVEQVAGLRADCINVGGGLTRSRLMPQILADVLGKPVATPAAPSVSTLGALMCAAAGSGVYNGLTQAASSMSRQSQVFLPHKLAQAEYIDTYERWLQAYENLRQMSSQLE